MVRESEGRSVPRRTRVFDLAALLHEAAEPLPIEVLTSALGLGPAELEAALGRLPALLPGARIHRTRGGIRLFFRGKDPEELRQRGGRIRRMLGHHHPDPARRLGLLREAGDLRRARALLKTLPPPPRCRPETRIRFLREALELAGDNGERRDRACKLSEELWSEGRIAELTDLCGRPWFRRSRDPRLRLWRARLLHRLARYSESLELTTSLLRSRDEAEDLPELHARNLLFCGRGRRALSYLEAALHPPSPTSTKAELALHLAYARCLQEVSPGRAAHLPVLARIVREARRRRDSELEARASLHVGLVLAERDAGPAAARWLGRARRAFITGGDAFYAGETENHLGLLFHRSGNGRRAREFFESAIRRLQEGGESRAIALVRLNLASLLLDLEDFERSRETLDLVLETLDPGLLRVRAEALGLRCDLGRGAAPDRILEALDRLERRIPEPESSPVLASIRGIRAEARILAGDPLGARNELEGALEILGPEPPPKLEAEILAELAGLESDLYRARTRLARALFRTRSDPPLAVRSARAALRGKPPLEGGALPLPLRRARELHARLLALRSGGPPPPVFTNRRLPLLESMCRTLLGADRGLLLKALPAFFRSAFEADSWLLLSRGPAGSWRRTAGGGNLDPARVLHWNRSGLPEAGEGSLLLVRSPGGGLLLCLGNSSLRYRYGTAEREALVFLLSILEERGIFLSRTSQEARPAPASRGAPSLPAAEGAEPSFLLPRPSVPPARGREGSRLSSPHPPLDGRDARIRAAIRLAEETAASTLPLVILGETGTGKSRFAAWIHETSDRRDGPLIVLDAATLRSGLGEAELCGHCKGAFTGAEQDRPGLLEQASGGTLILDNPEMLPETLQSILLGALERKEIRRLGSTRPRPLDLRCITTSREALEHWARRGLLRQDLLFRLQGVVFHLPPLRERIQDLPLLLTAMCREESPNDRPRAVDLSACEALMREDWPGNLRELRNRLRRALLLDPDREVLGPSLRNPAGPIPSGRPPSLRAALELEERRLLSESLAACGGHRGKAAEALGISRRWLQERLKALGLQDLPRDLRVLAKL